MKWKTNATQYERPAPGSHLGVCVAVIDLGTQPKTFQGVVGHERQVRLTFELPNEKMEGKYNPKDKGKPFLVSRSFKQSLHVKANLRKFLEGWRGRAFKQEELEGVDPRKFLGVPCRLNIIESEDGQYTNIDSVSPLGKGEKKPKAATPHTFFSLDPEEYSQETYEGLSEGLRKKIGESPEFAALTGNSPGEGSQSDAPDPEGDASPGDGDDVPF